MIPPSKERILRNDQAAHVASSVVLFFSLAAPSGIVSLATAGDWPQILGPDRSGKAPGEAVQREWGGQTPPMLWQQRVGQGYAGPAIVDGKVIVFHRQNANSIVEALDSATGKPVWKHNWPTGYNGGVDADTGPRCVPLVHKGAVYLHDVSGKLVCVDLASGERRWIRDTRRDFDLPDSYFGAGSSPVIADGKLLVNIGGRNEAGIVAFSLSTGETIWQSTGEGASYSSPIVVSTDSVPKVLFITRLNFVAVDPSNGAEVFSIPFGRRGPTVNGANPLLIDDHHVLLTASYGIGARLVRIESGTANEVWASGNLLASQYPTPIIHQRAVYGIDGREDIGAARLVCFDPFTQAVHWAEDGFGMATFIVAGSTLLAMKTDGQLVLINLRQDRYQELARFTLCDGTSRALPALADGRLFVRDAELLRCFDLRPPAR